MLQSVDAYPLRLSDFCSLKDLLGHSYRLFHTSLSTLRTPAFLANMDICCSQSFSPSTENPLISSGGLPTVIYGRDEHKSRGLQFRVFICCLSTPFTVALVYSGPGNYTKLTRNPWSRKIKWMTICAGAKGINVAVVGYPRGRRRSRIFVLREHISGPSR